MKLKKGVKLKDLTPQMVLAAFVIQDAARMVLGNHKYQATITSANDGRHMSGSKHYKGNGIDMRTYDMEGMETVVATTARDFLGENYDLVLEDDHIHVEYDPEEV